MHLVYQSVTAAWIRRSGGQDAEATVTIPLPSFLVNHLDNPADRLFVFMDAARLLVSQTS